MAQRKVLDIKDKDKREEFFRPAVGTLAPLLASLTYPDARPQSVEWLYRKRIQVRLDRDRAERRQKREEEAAQRKAEQPALFQF